MTTYDVLVAGGGPAGSVCSRELARAGCSVVLAEGSGYEGYRGGEVLAPSVRGELVGLGLWERFESLKPKWCPGALVAWGGPALREHDHLFHPHGRAWHVDRTGLDAMLCDAARDAGVEVRTSTRIGEIHGSPGTWESSGIRARFVVDATGRGASIARRLGGGRVDIDRLIGVVGLLRSARREGPARPLLIEAAPQGWWYSAELPDGHRARVLLTDADLWGGSRGALRAWHSPPPHTVQVENGAASVGAPRVLNARSGCLRAPVGLGWAGVGDAASSVDPLAGNGVLRALTSARHTARAVLADLSGDPTELRALAEHTRAAFADYVGRLRTNYRAEARWTDSAFWARRHRLPARLTAAVA